jgi:hypothetical protein
VCLWCDLYVASRLGGHLGRWMRRVVLKTSRSVNALLHSSGLVRIKGLPAASNQLVLSFWLALFWLPILLVAAIRTPGPLLNWPMMFATAVLFIILLLGPFAATPWLLKKLAKVAISICFLKGLWLLLHSAPMWDCVSPLGLTRDRAGFDLMMAGILVWFLSVVWLIISPEPMPRQSHQFLTSHPARPSL